MPTPYIVGRCYRDGLGGIRRYNLDTNELEKWYNGKWGTTIMTLAEEVRALEQRHLTEVPDPSAPIPELNRTDILRALARTEVALINDMPDDALYYVRQLITSLKR